MSIKNLRFDRHVRKKAPAFLRNGTGTTGHHAYADVGLETIDRLFMRLDRALDARDRNNVAEECSKPHTGVAPVA